jgi:hypothetical protein
MFQRIARIEVPSREKLKADWNEIRPGWRKRVVESIREHWVIQDAAIAAGNAWRKK